MSDQRIIFSPEHNQWTLTDGRHHVEVPEWARDIVRDEFERETRLLQAENAKLRELVRHMNTCLEHYEPDGSVGCEHCPLDNDTGNCDYERRMRELGIEVD